MLIRVHLLELFDLERGPIERSHEFLFLLGFETDVFHGLVQKLEFRLFALQINIFNNLLEQFLFLRPIVVHTFHRLVQTVFLDHLPLLGKLEKRVILLHGTHIGSGFFLETFLVLVFFVLLVKFVGFGHIGLIGD